VDNSFEDSQAAGKLLIRETDDFFKVEKDKYLSVEILLKDETGKIIKRKTSKVVASTNTLPAVDRYWRLFCGLSRAFDLLSYLLWMETF
jgi:hypothetical protein